MKFADAGDCRVCIWRGTGDGKTFILTLQDSGCDATEVADGDKGAGRGGIDVRRGSAGDILGAAFREGGRPKCIFPGTVSEGLSSESFEEISTLLTASSMILIASLS